MADISPRCGVEECENAQQVPKCFWCGAEGRPEAQEGQECNVCAAWTCTQHAIRCVHAGCTKVTCANPECVRVLFADCDVCSASICEEHAGAVMAGIDRIAHSMTFCGRCYAVFDESGDLDGWKLDE